MDLHEFFHQFHQVNRQLSKNMNERLTSLGLYSTQWTIIYYLKNYGPATQAKICQYLHVEAPTIARTVSRLEKGGWIKRKPGKDKREKLIDLTTAARDEFGKWREQTANFEAQVLKGIPIEEQQQMINIFKKMMDNMNSTGDDIFE